MGPKKEKIIELKKKMEDLGIKQADIQEKFIKSSGRGGQKVNKSSSAVFLKHIPTQLTVKYGKARSQHLNRYKALKLLVEKFEEIKFGTGSKELAKINKIRKQKKRRKKKTREKISRSTT